MENPSNDISQPTADRGLAALPGVAVGAIHDGALAFGGAPGVGVHEGAVLLEAP